MIKVRLSGGPNGRKFEGFQNKSLVERYIIKSFEHDPFINFEFVQGAKHAQYIVVPNEVAFASKSASLTGGEQLSLNEFIAKMKKESKKKSSGKKAKKTTKKTTRKTTKKVSKKVSRKVQSKKYSRKANRPSPSVSATVNEWKTKMGNDGNLWQSKPNKNGVFSWRKISAKHCSGKQCYL